MRIAQSTALAFLVCTLCVRVSAAQNITGSTTVDIDPDTGAVTVICETDMDDNADAYYQASVSCTVRGDGTFIGAKSSTDSHGRGSAVAFFQFAGIPGTTYTAVGTHSGVVFYSQDPGIQNAYYDPYNFSSYSETGVPVDPYPDTYDWFGFGPPTGTATQRVTTGNTTAQKNYPQVPTSLKVLSVTVVPTGITNSSGCQPSADYGIKIDIKYQVLDQASLPKPILKAGMTPYETVQFATGGTSIFQPICTTGGNSNCAITTASDGTFHDVPLGACGPAGFSNANELQIIYIDSTGQKVRQNRFIIGSSGQGHGSITNSSDISTSR